MIKKSWFILELFTDLPEDHTTNFAIVEQVENITVVEQVENITVVEQVENITVVEQVENITVQVSEIIDKEHYIYEKQTGGDIN